MNISFACLLSKIALLVAATSAALLAPGALNFEYEYTLAAGSSILIFTFLYAGLLPLKYQLKPFNPSGSISLFSLFWFFLIAPSIYLGTTFILYAFTGCHCSPAGLLFWSVLEVLPSIFLAEAFSSLATVYRSKLINEKWSDRLTVTAVLGIIFFSLLLFDFFQFYTEPQARISSLLLGFLHGPIYDLWIPVDGGVFLARTTHSLIGIGFFFFSVYIYNRKWSKIIAPIFLGSAAILLAFVAGTYDSIGSGHYFLKKHLPLTEHSQNGDYTLHYNKITAEKFPRRFAAFKEELAFHSEDLHKRLGFFTPTEVYLYESQNQKKILFGGGSTDVTDIYTPSIHITLENFPHSTLRHELVHAALSKKGFHGLGFHPNILLTEGIAVALAPAETSASLDASVGRLFLEKKKINLDRLFSPMFWLDSGTRAYTVAGSFISYLVSEFGLQKFVSVYNGESFEKVYRSRPDLLAKKWRKKIEAVLKKETTGLDTKNQLLAPSLFDDHCPHSKVDLAKNRSDSIFVRLRQSPGWSPEDDYYHWLRTSWPEDPEIEYDFLKHEAEKLVNQRPVNKEGLISILALLEKEALPQPGKFQLSDILKLILKSDIEFVLDQHKKSLATLLTLKAFESGGLNIGQALHRQVSARLKISDLSKKDHLLSWRRYLAGWEKTIPTMLSEPSWIQTYLKLRALKLEEVSSTDLVFLEQKISAKSSGDFILDFEAEKVLGYAFFTLGDFSAASLHLAKARELAPPGSVDLIALTQSLTFFTQKNN